MILSPRLRSLLGTAIVLALAITTLTFTARVVRGSEPAFPLRAAFYYPWFPEAWKQLGIEPYTQYDPSLGFYDSSSPPVIADQITAMQYGNIDVGIASWWGQETPTDKRIPLLLAGASNTIFRWTLYYEAEGYSDPTVPQIENDLAYLGAKYATDPGYLRIGGRPVIFVYADAADACGMATRWAQANASGTFYVVMKVFSGYLACPDQPDQWHQYGPATAEDSQPGHSFTISPGFWKAGEATPRLARDLTAWTQDIADMVASNAPFQLITTFDEWGEGTSVESAAEWATPSGFGAYLDALHANPGQGGGVIAPTVTTPKVALPSSVTLGRSGVIVTADWTGTAYVGSTIDHYDVQVRKDGGGWVDAGGTAGPSKTFTLASGHAYVIRVRAVNSAKTSSSWSLSSSIRPVAYQEGSSRIAYRGFWSTRIGSYYYGSRDRAARVYGRRASLTFTGRSVAWVSRLGNSSGRAWVYVNGTHVATINLHRTSSTYRRVVWSKTWSNSATRTIRVLVRGTRGHPRVDVDAFLILR